MIFCAEGSRMRYKLPTNFFMKKYNKFGATPTKRRGINFASKLEAKYFDYLNLLKLGGEVAFFLRQVPFDLPGNVKYFVDFLVFYENGNIDFVDVKGFETPQFKIKKKMVEDLYPIEINVVKSVRD